jgi:CRP-like cAMP-binding protein
VGAAYRGRSAGSYLFRDIRICLVWWREAGVQSEVESEFDNSDRRIAFPAKSNVLTEGEPSIAIYMLTRGTAALYKMLADGRRQVVGFALPGDFLGSPFSDRYPYSVDEINEVVARQFLRGSFLTFLRAHPNSLCFMLEAAWQENNAARDHMLLLGRGTAEEKFAEFIVGEQEPGVGVLSRTWCRCRCRAVTSRIS